MLPACDSRGEIAHYIIIFFRGCHICVAPIYFKDVGAYLPSPLSLLDGGLDTLLWENQDELLVKNNNTSS